MSFRWLRLFNIVILTSGLALSQTRTVPSESPAAAALRIRRTDAENRMLFQSAEPLRFTLEANFGPVTRDREPESTKQYPGVIKIVDGDRTIQIPVQLAARGHLRRRTCDFI